jgi:adenosylcobinamide kinase/adenosylcobinamide-phosphate guanylyltransferase
VPTTPIERGDGANDRGGNDRGGLVVRAVPGGWDVTGGDGERLLCASGPGGIPEPPLDALPYDYAVLDLLGDPFQLGGLRRRGLVTDTTGIALAGADHRAASEDEVAENCRFWRVQRMSDGDVMRPDRDGGEQGRVLVVGGARSGKSERAERRIAAEAAVTYVATGVSAADDAEWAARIAAHRARRPSWWVTVETTDLAGVLAGTGTVLIDGVGSWLARVMGECGAWEESDGWPVRLAERTNELVQAWRNTRCSAIAVSDEAGLGVIPGSAAGRIFRDTLGTLNQALARESEITEFVLAGRVMRLPLW